VVATGLALLLELKPSGDSTELTITYRYTPRFGALGDLIRRAVVGTVTRSPRRSADAVAAIVAREMPVKASPNQT